MEGFTSLQACHLTGCTQNQLRYWDKIGLVKPSIQETGGRSGVRRLYSFRDLVALKVVTSLLNEGMSLQRVRRAYTYLREHAGLDQHLSSVKLITDGRTIFRVSEDESEVLDALRQGQLTFTVTLDKLVEQVNNGVHEFQRDREQFVRALRSVEQELEEEERPRRRRAR